MMRWALTYSFHGALSQNLINFNAQTYQRRFWSNWEQWPEVQKSLSGTWFRRSITEGNNLFFIKYLAQNVALLRFSCFLTPIWPETSGLRLPFYNQQSDNSKTHLQKEISLKNTLLLSILSFQVEKKKHPFFHRMSILFIVENQD